MVCPGCDRLGCVVQVDEIYIGGVKKRKGGRDAHGKALVLIAAEEDGRRTGRIRLHRVSDASSGSLMPAVKMCVKSGSLVRTDGWRGYSLLTAEGHEHSIVRDTADVGDNLLPLVNRAASLLKRWRSGTHQGAVRISQVDYYLDEYTFRFIRRTSKSRGKLFYRLVQQAVAIDPFTADQIKGGTGKGSNHNILGLRETSG